MMKHFFTLLAFSLATMQFARAEELYTTIFNVLESSRSETILVLSGADGRVYRTPKSEATLKYYKSLIGEVVKLEYFNSGKSALIAKITKALPGQVNQQELDLNHFRYNELRQFAPTDLQSLEAATDLFNSMLNDGDRRRSQCFKRAHMWAFDMWSKLGISSQKIFIFYTKRYSILEDFEWWFHVAPMVVAGGEEYVLDGTFMTKPITVKEWKDYFIKSENVTCPEITNYSEYQNKQWSRLCFLMKTSMYHFSPLDIEYRDAKGIKRNNWVLEELQDARRAFKGYDTTYEGLDTGNPTITY